MQIYTGIVMKKKCKGSNGDKCHIYGITSWDKVLGFKKPYAIIPT